MSPAAMRVLRLMLANKDNEDGELVREGREVWLGYERVGSMVINQLLQLCAIADVSDEGKGLERYVINSTGEALVVNPLLESALVQALHLGRSFTIIDGKIQDI